MPASSRRCPARPSTCSSSALTTSEGDPRLPGWHGRPHQRGRRRHRPHRRRRLGGRRRSPLPSRPSSANGGGLIGVGEPSGHQYQGRYLQLAQVLGVEKETGFTLGYDKYNWDEHPDHFILADCAGRGGLRRGQEEHLRPGRHRDPGPAGQGGADGGERLRQRAAACTSAACPTPLRTAVVLYRAILWAAHERGPICTSGSPRNYNVEVHAFVKNGKYCVVNNTYEPQHTTVYTRRRQPAFELDLDANEIRWYEISTITLRCAKRE